MFFFFSNPAVNTKSAFFFTLFCPKIVVAVNTIALTCICICKVESRTDKVTWSYVVNGKKIPYPKKYNDVLEPLYQRLPDPENPRRTPFVTKSGVDCLIDLDKMIHVNLMTGKVFPLHRKVIFF